MSEVEELRKRVAKLEEQREEDIRVLKLASQAAAAVKSALDALAQHVSPAPRAVIGAIGAELSRLSTVLQRAAR